MKIAAICVSIATLAVGIIVVFAILAVTG